MCLLKNLGKFEIGNKCYLNFYFKFSFFHKTVKDHQNSMKFDLERMGFLIDNIIKKHLTAVSLSFKKYFRI